MASRTIAFPAGTHSPRRRRTPEEARREILTSAEEVLKGANPTELTVASLMAGTEMTRKSFYVHFSDLGELIVALVKPLREKLDGSIGHWAEAADPRTAGAEALERAAAHYIAHATLLRTVQRNAALDPAVAAAWRELIEPLIDTGTRLLRDYRGFSSDRARTVATVLGTMNVQSLLELGPDAKPSKVSATTGAIREVWESVIFRDAAPKPTN